MRHILHLLVSGFLLLTGVLSSHAQVYFINFSGSALVNNDAPLAWSSGKGSWDGTYSSPLSPASGYRGPVFYGTYGRTANGDVDAPLIKNDVGPTKQDMLTFTEGSMGNDRLYALVMFSASSYEGAHHNKPASLAYADALTLKTHTAYVGDQVGWLYFVVESEGRRYVSNPFSYTKKTSGEWGTFEMTIDNPRDPKWTWSVLETEDNTGLIKGGLKAGNPNFDSVTAVGFAFWTSSSTKKDGRIFVEKFIVRSGL